MGEGLRATIAGLSSATVLAPLGISGFVGLWVSASAGSFARLMAQVAVGWIALEVTGSPFLVGVVLAVQKVPQLVLGIPAGIAADLIDRRTLLILVNAASVLWMLAIAGLAAGGLLSLPAIVLAGLGIGILDMLRVTATQAYAYDLARGVHAARSLALVNVGIHLLGMVSSSVGGVALEWVGGPGTFVVVASALLVAAATPAIWAAQASASGPRTPRARPDLWRAATLLARDRLVAMVALAIVVTEVLGFSSLTLMPTFARDVFDVGAAGLGAMLATRSAGGVLSLLVLARFGAGDRAGAVLLLAAGGMGLALVAFALAPAYLLALVLMALVGASASAVDTLGQVLLQRLSDDRERGAAMGIWVCAVGFGPIGHLALGAAASEIGAPPAQAASGALLALVAATLAFHAPLRRGR